MLTVHVERSGDGWRCMVTIDQGKTRTHHTVIVTKADAARWSGGSGSDDAQDLVRRSFEFLLEREPPGSILKTFELSAIQRYFPEYDRLFRSRSDPD